MTATSKTLIVWMTSALLVTFGAVGLAQSVDESVDHSAPYDDNEPVYDFAYQQNWFYDTYDYSADGSNPYLDNGTRTHGSDRFAPGTSGPFE